MAIVSQKEVSMTIFIGIDWSETHHDICILQENGSRLSAFQVEHTPDGFATLEQQIEKLGLPAEENLVALETAHNLLMDFLLDHHYSVYVLAPSIVKSSRGRFGSSGARTDQRDAHLLADMLRTDRARFALWKPNGPIIRQMQVQLGFIDDLTHTITRFSNRLRAQLLRYFPSTLDLFSDLTTQITLHFLIAHPTPRAARALTYDQFVAFCHSHAYSHPQDMPKNYACLHQPTLRPDPAIVTAHQKVVPFLATLLLTAVRRKKQAIREVQQLFVTHPDQAIFASLPGAGQLLAPKLLVMFGDHRDHYPSPDAIQALAGTCPVTIHSGKSKSIRFRRACNRDFRRTAQQLALFSVRQSPWAAAYFADALSRGHGESHAYRCLANRWLAIAWTLWQRSECYDESRHLRDVNRHRRPRPT
jgi:transposase